LTLTYTPTADASGTLSIGFAYTDNAGAAKTGTVSIPYAATEHDNVLSTTSPAGQVTDVIGNAPRPVTVTFTTDDGNPAHALSITSGLSSLPLGWSSSASSFTCATASTGTGCQLHLTFTPTATATGTLAFGYAYTDNAGSAKTGTVTIHYVSTSHNTILGTPNPAGTVRVKVGLSEPIAVTFTTNDGNTATDFQITSNLSPGSLPGGWSGPNGFSCNTVSSGAGCAITLTYAPATNATGTITLDFSYIDSASTAQTGSATVSYSNPHLYVFGNTTNFCTILANGTLDTCSATALSANTVNAFGPGTISGTSAYIPGGNADFYTCVLENDGSLDTCTDNSLTSSYPVYGFSAYGSYVYVNNYANVYVCTASLPVSLSNCPIIPSASNPNNYWYGLSVNGSFGYITNYGTPYLCTVSPTDGTLNNCATISITGNNSSISGAGAIKIYGGYVYATGGAGVTTCAIANDGTLPNCNLYSVAGQSAVEIAILDTDAYVSTGGDIYHCAVDQTTGVVSSCTLSDGGLTNIGSYGLLAQ